MSFTIGPVTWDLDDGAVRCGGCEATLCTPEQNWRDHCAVSRGPASERLRSEDLGAAWRLHPHPDVELAEFFCPACRALLSVEWYLRGEAHRWTFRTLEAAAGDGYDAPAEFRADPGRWISY
jgi:hypothetical protein